MVFQDSMDRSEAKVFRAHVNAPKLLANQQTGGDILVEVLVEDLQERSRLKMIED